MSPDIENLLSGVKFFEPQISYLNEALIEMKYKAELLLRSFKFMFFVLSLEDDFPSERVAAFETFCSWIYILQANSV